MTLQDSVTVFVRRPMASDPYDRAMERFVLRNVMAYEREEIGPDGREAGKLTVYFFPSRSRVVGGGPFPPVKPGDFCAAGIVSDPKRDLRRITAIERRTAGTERACHIVLEAV